MGKGVMTPFRESIGMCFVATDDTDGGRGGGSS